MNPKVTDEMVDRVARAIYERRCSLTWGVKPPLWDSVSCEIHYEWREIARAGLRAAGTVTAAHLCETCAQTKCWTRRDIEDACEDALFPARAVVVECKAYVAGTEEAVGGDEGVDNRVV